jgi:hypothetical protein
MQHGACSCGWIAPTETRVAAWVYQRVSGFTSCPVLETRIPKVISNFDVVNSIIPNFLITTVFSVQYFTRDGNLSKLFPSVIIDGIREHNALPIGLSPILNKLCGQ